jgi:hypothetical protein
MQNVNVASGQFHVLSNGAIIFGVSLILCTGIWKMDKLVTETVLALNLHFQHIAFNLQATGKSSAPFERA